MHLDSYNQYSAPLARSYQRKVRFLSKVDRLLGIVTPPATSAMWEVLDKQKDNLHNPDDVRKALRGCKVVMKHYDSLRTFTDSFTTFKCESYDTLRTRDYLEKRFTRVHSDWGRNSENKFYSYDWLIRVFLEEINSPLLVYLKPKTSKRREKRYIEMFKRSRIDDRRCYREPVKDHFQSV